ncbi:NADPH-dependent FMN reductase family protein [Pseudomonas antarctica]|uniref:NAD(P)H-dependent oxidoreductase n=1 Tax=Pseudomonas antarctica TaxID=219572 RepID=UPI0018D2FD3A|nr:NAD(P)H-dependent oxidoreductase [Pseudomonas antarctica]
MHLWLEVSTPCLTAEHGQGMLAGDDGPQVDAEQRQCVDVVGHVVISTPVYNYNVPAALQWSI